LKRLKRDWTVATFIGILLVACALAGSCQAATYESMKSYEDLLRSQTMLIGSFENLLKNSTLIYGVNNDHYKFLDSFDDLAMREQLGLNSFEDLVSRNWSTLLPSEKISLTQSFEDLIRREATVLSSNEDLLKRGYCSLEATQKQNLLDRFEARLKYQVNLYTKFEDWLHFQQMIEDTEKNTWIGFLESFEDLIRKQANLLDSFEMLLKTRCDTKYLTLTKSVLSQTGNTVTYRYHLIAKNKTANITVKDSILGVVKTYPIVPAGFDEAWNYGPVTLTCADCNNCTCKVCNFATACGEIVTPNGNFTVCVVSNQFCVTVQDSATPVPNPGDIHPGIKINESTTEESINEEVIKELEAPAENASQETNSCPSCSN